MIAKKYISIILLLLILVAIVGYYPAFRLLQSKIKHEFAEFKREANSKDIIAISFTTCNGKIVDDNYKSLSTNEFIFNQHYFDVVKKVIEKNRIIFYCFTDNDETNLVNANNNHTFSLSNAGQTNSKKNISYKINLDDFVVTSFFYFQYFPNASLQNVFTKTNFVENTHSIIAPPPWLV
jgi:hypothetical protein